ncbi:hypothetical protein J2S98_000985 [Arthrobacter oryzae]|uniref:hypothetical protein n=1 Tax=Arthrobacter TaxID=1663 RepID=UPI00278AD9A0|nr:hypothetical protein [Arthrobacter oryzae]MDP9985840.1 hypothetical protein [Arthrobacter oryzae]
METLQSLIVEATTRSEVDEKLNASIQRLQGLAQQEPFRGILVTHQGPGRYSVKLSDQVPYGETWEMVQFVSHEAEWPIPCEDR